MLHLIFSHTRGHTLGAPPVRFWLVLVDGLAPEDCRVGLDDGGVPQHGDVADVALGELGDLGAVAAVPDVAGDHLGHGADDGLLICIFKLILTARSLSRLKVNLR